MTVLVSVPPIKPKEPQQQSKLMVAVRIRPLSHKEEVAASGQKAASHGAVIAKAVDDKSVMVYDPTEYFSGSRPREKIFEFDHVFGDKETQDKVFTTCVKQQIDAVMNGYNATVFAYGATGAGKTYTMMGVEDNPGIMGRTLNDLFTKIASIKTTGTYKVSISYLEIYNEKIRDLLTGKLDNLELQEDPAKGVVVSGITYMSASNPEAILGLLRKGNKNRIQEATGQNETSSRSHAILQIYVAFRSKESKTQSRFAKLSLCDLAGSERAAETNNRGMRMIEGANINRSLLALGNCINSLIDPGKKDYVNYRDSKLTRLLKDSLGGNCQTVMIANISPSTTNYDETMNTLKYASRARNIKNKISQQPSENAIKSLQQFQEDFINIKGDSIHSLVRNTSAESFSSPLPNSQKLSNNLSSAKASSLAANNGSTNKKSTAASNPNEPKINTSEMEDTLQNLFVKQLEIKARELDHDEFDMSHLRKQNRLKFEMNKLDQQLNQTKNENKKKLIRSKIQKFQVEFHRIQSLIAKNQAAKQALARDAHGIDAKVFKIQETSKQLKEGHFAQFIKSEIKMHQMEMNGLGLELKNALNLKLARQKETQLSKMSEILNHYQKVTSIQSNVIQENSIKIPELLLTVEQELQKCIKMFNDESTGVFLDSPIDFKDRSLVKESSKVSISLGRIASGLSKLLSTKSSKKETPPTLDVPVPQKPSFFEKDPSNVSLKISMVPSEKVHASTLPPIYPTENSVLTLSSVSRSKTNSQTPPNAPDLENNILKKRFEKEVSRFSM